jgi:hypothetical protein
MPQGTAYIVQLSNIAKLMQLILFCRTRAKTPERKLQYSDAKNWLPELLVNLVENSGLGKCILKTLLCRRCALPAVQIRPFILCLNITIV